MKNSKKLPKLSFWQIATLVLAVVLLAAWGGKWPKISGTSGVRQIQPAQLKEMLAKKDFFLINVHTPYEGEIAKTDLFVDYDKIDQVQDKLPKDKSTKIILYCQTGRMSGLAAKKLAELGYTNVSHLSGGMVAWKKAGNRTFNVEELKRAVLPEQGFAAPVKWGKLGPTLVSLGVIDLAKFKEAVKPTEGQLEILQGQSNEFITINKNNAQFIVDMLWALGLAQKSQVYIEGPMGKDYKKDAGNFASTGGWTIGKAKAMTYYNRYDLVNLTPEQQKRVLEISKNIYRPCCGNPTSFPDCNHGMAALGLVELMVANGNSDDEIYKTVLGFNAFWFPQNYLTTAAHFALEGIAWDKVEAKKALGQDFSSGQGAAKINQEIGGLPYLYRAGGGSCGV